MLTLCSEVTAFLLHHDSQLATDVLFNIGNNQIVVVLERVTLHELGANAATHLFRLVTQSNGGRIGEGQVGLGQRPRFRRPINVDQRCGHKEIVDLNNKNNKCIIIEWSLLFQYSFGKLTVI